MLPSNSIRYKQYSNHTLKIKKVGQRDAGTYTCQADNRVGPAALWNVDLQVEFYPEELGGRRAIYDDPNEISRNARSRDRSRNREPVNGGRSRNREPVDSGMHVFVNLWVGRPKTRKFS